MSTPTKKVAFHTLGCKLNFSETSTIARDFIVSGYEKVDFNDFADFYVVLQELSFLQDSFKSA